MIMAPTWEPLNTHIFRSPLFTAHHLHLVCVDIEQLFTVTLGYDGLVCIWDIKSVRGSKPHLVAKIKSITQSSANIKNPEYSQRSEILCLEYHKHCKAIFIGGNDCQIQVKLRDTGKKSVLSCIPQYTKVL